jgi:hypothetical protein
MDVVIFEVSFTHDCHDASKALWELMQINVQ